MEKKKKIKRPLNSKEHCFGHKHYASIKTQVEHPIPIAKTNVDGANFPKNKNNRAKT